MEKLLTRYNPWWEDSGLIMKQWDDLYSRSKYIDHLEKSIETKMITFLTGLRRVGKTTLMFLLIKRLIESGVSAKRILYISLNDYILQDKSILEIIEEFRTIHKIPFKDKVYLFLDEVTYKDDFEIQLKNIYDGHYAKVFASSSSASILGEKQHYLTGRSSLTEVLPLDFNEYLDFKSIEITSEDSNLRGEYFKEYMQVGGIPEYVQSGSVSYLQELVDDILYKDIAVKHGVKDVQVLKDFFLLLMERAGKQVSINKVANILGISVDSARRYFDMFVSTYLIYPVVRFGKTNERLMNPKKIYAADLGIKNHFTGFRDIGAIFENYVFLQLKSNDLSYYYKDKYELDFVVNKDTLVEVKYRRNIEGKQKDVYDKADFDNKYIIQSLDDVDKLSVLINHE